MGKILSEKEAEDFLEKEGFPVVQRKLVKNPEEAIRAAQQMDYPVAMKVYAPEIIHKSDVGGVKLDIRNNTEVVECFAELMRIKHAKGVTVQKYTEGLFLLLGLKEDASFGHAIVVGGGGIYTEVLKDVSFRVCPIDQKEALTMLQELKMYQLLTGIRGHKAVHLKKLSKLIAQLSRLPAKHKNIAELDINPLVVYENTMIIVDARMRLS